MTEALPNQHQYNGAKPHLFLQLLQYSVARLYFDILLETRIFFVTLRFLSKYIYSHFFVSYTSPSLQYNFWILSIYEKYIKYFNFINLLKLCLLSSRTALYKNIWENRIHNRIPFLCSQTNCLTSINEIH